MKALLAFLFTCIVLFFMFGSAINLTGMGSGNGNQQAYNFTTCLYEAGNDLDKAAACTK